MQPKQTQHCPFEHNSSHYGAKLDQIIHDEERAFLDDDIKIIVQQVVGRFLYYVQAVDFTILTALNAITTEQEKPTKCTMIRA